MEKIVLFAFVVLAAVLMANSSNVTTPAPTTTGSPMGNATQPPQMNATSTAAPEPSTLAPTAAVTAIQPLAIFVLASAFLGLMH